MLYDKKFLKQLLVLFVGVAALCKVSGGMAIAVVFPVIFWAISQKRSEWLLAMLFYLPLATCTNQELIPKTAGSLMIIRGGMVSLGAIMTFMVFGRHKGLFIAPLLGILGYVFYMFVPSMMGWAPLVSFFKLFLFIFMFLGYASIGGLIMTDQRDNIPKVRSAMMAFGIYIAVFSVILLIVRPGMAYMSRDDMTEAELLANLAGGAVSLFKGMTQHSQVMGPMAAMICVLFAGDYLFSVRRHLWIYDVIIACAMVCLWKSSSRTAMGTVLIGLMVLGWCFMGARGIGSKWKRIVLNLAVVAGIMGVLAVIAVAPLRESLLGFVLKYGGSDSQAVKMMTTEDILASRQSKLDGALYNWRKSPVIGNGFQVSEDMSSVKSIKEMITMPVEKSTWVYANLEEGGVVGSLIFVVWVMMAFFALRRRHVYVGLSCFVAMIVLNLGEYTIFSLSYTGAVVWCVVIAGCVMDSQRYKLEKLNHIKASEQEAAFLAMMRAGEMRGDGREVVWVRPKGMRR